MIGIGVPALVLGMSDEAVAVMELWWLLGLTALATSLMWRGRRLSRRDGVIVVAVYIAFVAARVLWG